MSAQEQPLEEFCPRCGVWVAGLDEWTGWCASCATAGSGEVCRRCGERRPAGWYRTGKHARGICRACRTAQRTKYRRDHADAERAYSTQRYKRLGSGECPVCGYQKRLTGDGVLSVHQPSHRFIAGGERCAGSGQPLTTHNPHVRVDPEPSEASTT